MPHAITGLVGIVLNGEKNVWKTWESGAFCALGALANPATVDEYWSLRAYRCTYV